MAKKEDLLLFYDFLKVYGFNPYNYRRILELNSSVEESISQYLKDYNQFLLSEKVEYKELEKYGIEGACGYLESDSGIIVPKSLEADDYFERHKPLVSYKIHGYVYPGIDEFDTIVTTHEWERRDVEQLMFSKNYPMENFYIGTISDILDKNDERSSNRLNLYCALAACISDITPYEHEVINERVSGKNKELYLIRRKSKSKN